MPRPPSLTNLRQPSFLGATAAELLIGGEQDQLFGVGTVSLQCGLPPWQPGGAGSCGANFCIKKKVVGVFHLMCCDVKICQRSKQDRLPSMLAPPFRLLTVGYARERECDMFL